MALAFFDLDRTLLAVNSGSLWLKSELESGFLTRWQVFRAATWIARYHLGMADLEETLRLAIRSLRGSREVDIRARTTAFYRERVRHQFRPRAREVLEAHRRGGDRLVLLTSSSNYLSELVAEDLGLDDILCNRFEVDPQGLHTGHSLGALCFGDGKRVHAEALASKLAVRLESCAFYTDSYSDMPVLRVVGRPVAVNPDQRLRRAARKAGWEIADWGKPGT